MRTYLVLAEKAHRFHADPDIQDALRAAQAHRLAEPTVPEGPAGLERLRAERPDLDALGAQGYGHERLDQLVTELLLGVR
jgi:xylose isomerase